MGAHLFGFYLMPTVRLWKYAMVCVEVDAVTSNLVITNLFLNAP